MAGHSDRGFQRTRYFDDPGQRGKKAVQASQSRTGEDSRYRQGERSMGETPDQIERHIYEKRSELGENIHELQQKVKTAVDWRAQFDQRPWVLMGAAFGGGVLLALLFGGRGDSSRSSSPDAWKREAYRTGNVQPRNDKTNAIWENIRGAALAVAGSRLGNVLEDVLPGFQEQYRRRQREQQSYSTSRPNGPETGTRRTASGETDYVPQS